MRRALLRRDGAGFGAVSREDRSQAERFFTDLVGPARSPRLMLPRPRDEARLRMPPPTEHQTYGAPVLRAGNVGTAVDARAGHQVTFDLAASEPSPKHVAAAYPLAGTDAQRWDWLRWGLFDATTSAAIAIRGGHGATRLLD
jgi:hypothetical protein